MLAGECVADRTIDNLLAADCFERLVVAVAPDDDEWLTLRASKNALVERVDGGISRALSVLGGLEAIADRAHQDDWVLVHDIARPLVLPSDIRRFVEFVYERGSGALMVGAIHDTVKQVTDKGTVAHTVPRSTLRAAQTPQMFRYGELLSAIRQALVDGVSVTDEASAVEYSGNRVLIYEQSSSNIKITTPEDLAVAEFLWQQRVRSATSSE